jgi:carbonic anhydrase
MKVHQSKNGTFVVVSVFLQATFSSIRGSNNRMLEKIWQEAAFAAKNGMYRCINVFMHLYIYIYLNNFIYTFTKYVCI